MEEIQRKSIPHILIFPLPLQGPVNCMLKMAEIFLCADSDIHVTFLNTEHIHHRLLSHTDVRERFRRYPNFRFATLPDGMPEDSQRGGDEIGKMIKSMEEVTWPLLREMVTRGPACTRSENPVSCLIVDGIFGCAVDVAKEIGVPLFYFDTISPSALWIYMCVPKLIEVRELPFQGWLLVYILEGGDLDAPITCVPGMESILRRRDLPSNCQPKNLDEPSFQNVLKERENLLKAQGLIFNTFEGLDGHILQHFKSICPNIYAIGPLHTHHKTRVDSKQQPKTSNSLLKEDFSCMDWLVKQPEKSVFYVSLGSLVVISQDQLMELWHGLVKSGVRFLWVQRPGSIIPSGPNFEDLSDCVELSRGTKERGCIVSWAPQEEVLAHPSIAGFLTHSGWNSTLESIAEGVPMICWPYFVDQQVNSRNIAEVWKLGLDMKELCDRNIIEKMIRELMEIMKDELLKRSDKMAKLAKQSVSKGGTSYQDMERLINDIRSMKIQASHA